MPTSVVLNVVIYGFDAALHQFTPSIQKSSHLPALVIDLDKLVDVECCVIVPPDDVRGVGAGRRSRIKFRMLFADFRANRREKRL